MWVGGNIKPYRPNCAGSIDCQLGPRYQHGKASDKGVARFIYDSGLNGNLGVNAITDVDGTPPAVNWGPVPYERWSNVDNCTASNNCVGTDYEDSFCSCANWYNAAYTGSGFSICGGVNDIDYFNLAHQQPVHFSQPQMLVAESIADGGSGYAAGQTLTPPGGTTTDGVSTASVNILAVDGTGKITAAIIVARGSYWTNPTSPSAVTGGTGTGASFNLTFGLETTDRFFVCRKRGDKAVAAKRWWHGRFGFLGEDLDTKYLTFSVMATVIIDRSQCPGPGADGSTLDEYPGDQCGTGPDGSGPPWDYDPYVCESSAGRTTSVDKQTGVTTLDFCSDTGDFTGQSCCCYEPDTPTTGDLNSLLGSMLTSAYSIPSPGDTTWGGYPITSFTNTEIIAELVESGPDYPCDAGSDVPGYPPTNTVTNTYRLTASLSNTNTKAEVNFDCKSLLAYWDLSDDRQYPWRDGNHPQIMPLVSRNEVQANVEPGLIVDCAYIDPNAALYDGSILGKPQPAGYENQWDSRASDTKFCCNVNDDETLSPETNNYGYGGVGGAAASAKAANGAYGAQLPLNCTQWTDPGDAIFFMPGAFTKYADKRNFTDGNCSGVHGTTSNPALWMVKYAVIKEKFPSQNMARPGGDDAYAGKFAYVEVASDGTSQVYSAVNVSGSGAGSVWALLTWQADIPAVNVPAGGDVWGGKVTGGFFEVAGYDPGTGNVTLGAKKFDLPSDWASRSGDDAVCFGKLRWAATAPGILGRMALDSITDLSPAADARMLIADSPLTCLGLGADAETITLCGADMTVLADGLTVTKIKLWQASNAYTSEFIIDSNGNLQQATGAGTSGPSAPAWLTGVGDPTSDGGVTWTLVQLGVTPDTAFTVPTALATVAAAKWITSQYLNDGTTPGTHFWFYDQYPKNDFVTMTYTFDNSVSSGHVASYTMTPACLPFNPCEPQVVCYSPNYPAIDNFPNGVTYDIPDSTMDETNGSQWQGAVIMSVPDPIVQPPHHPVQAIASLDPLADPGTMTDPVDITWSEDDGGTCPEDSFGDGVTTLYYPKMPRVEPLSDYPSSGPDGTETAPTMPDGIDFEFDDALTNFPPLGMIGASFAGGILNGIFDDRILLENMQVCVSAPGRFSEIYGQEYGLTPST